MTTDLIEEYVKRSSWRSNANANWNYSFSGLQSYIAGTILAKDAIKEFGKFGKRHIDGSYHLHNLENGKFGRYCNGNDLLTLLQKGLINVGGITAKPAKHFSSLCDQIVNYTYLMTGEFAGAQAWRDIDILSAPFIYNDDLNYNKVKQEIQQLIWNLSFNLRPGYQSPFVNFTLGLRPSKYYKDMKAVVGGGIQKDYYSDFQDEIDLFNDAFLDIMIEGPGDGKPFTFPLPTYNITKDFNWDSEVNKKIFELASKWGTPYFANYVNSTMSEDDALSMCPLAGNEKVLIQSNRYKRFEYSTIANLDDGCIYSIYSDGKFVRGKFNKYINQDMLKITLNNNHTVEMSTKHLNFIKRNKTSNEETLRAEKLTTDMYLPYSLNVFEGEGGNRDFGYLIGAYAGDGSFDADTTIIFSLSQEGIKNKKVVSELIRISKQHFGANSELFPSEDTKLLTLKIYSKAIVGMCKEFVLDKQRNKCYSPKVFEMSKEFREGVIEGHLDTDGGNRHRIYTSSIKMVESLNMLAATLGTTTSIYKDSRKGRLGIEPNYAVLIYQLNRDSYGDVWFKENNKLWVKIKSIKSTTKSTAYCFEVMNNEPIFTIGTTGILTHNCRLRLNLKEVQKVSGGIWNFGANTGSLAVFTINMSRIGYMTNGNDEKFYKILDSLLEDGKNYLIAKKECIFKSSKLGLFPMTNVYIGDKLLKTYFLTIGINGLNECSINFCDKNILENVDWCEKVLAHISQKVLEFQQETGQLFNFEATPGEGCSYTLAKLDVDKFPGIFTQGTEKVPFYTGSSLIPANIEMLPETAMKHQEKLQRHYTGGTVFHIDEGRIDYSPKAVECYIRRTCKNYTLPYITWSPTYTICPTHGKSGGKYACCDKAEIYSRVVGYYRPVERWNAGKKEEFNGKKFLKGE